MTRMTTASAESAKLSSEWIQRFQSAVLTWFASRGRVFPWRHTSNPFHILIAEVLLRQTQAGRVARPYLELIERYPDARSMAQADVDWLREWFRPLGLVQRADRLVQTARILVSEHEGQVPSDLKILMKLPGLGIYSVRAILCLVFGATVPMIDEGSGRVLRRVFGLAPKGAAYSDANLLEIAAAIVPRGASREFNLGLIDIAAAYCHPRSPECPQCPLVQMCAYRQYDLGKGARSKALTYFCS